MKGFRIIVLALSVLGLVALPVLAGAVKKFDYKNDAPEAEARAFSSLVGNWHIDRDGNRNVYAVDGRKGEQGLMAAGAKEKAKGLYGERYAEFLGNLETYRYFPLTLNKEFQSFRNGTIEVSFKGVSGRIDQAAGIAFNIKPNGDYLVVRANALENNLVLFRMEGGRRSSVEWSRNVPVPSNQWHTLKVVINGNKIEGYLNNRKYIDHTWKENIDGRIGLWSKADSYVFFDNFSIETK
ncbi:family 16 glycoside hydrolase [Geobacter argillaceus]|uniref:Uncharacterized protein DUF1080 n=1 Tax=Geobacter argillaceus TaxID=345631 RepID=A0A562VHZ6_9BACT|nr:family 16 glycoside hydrolase [Geobacter argillaceus]TWJ17566.1 uncharacterized protein DUF1080 [Geobacter argillaceus]